MPSSVLIPHLKWPIRFTSRGADVVEQDSMDDIAQCLLAILRTPQGLRHDLPDFGIPDLLFREGGVDIAGIQEAIEEWEPRALTFITENPDEFDEMIRRVMIELRGPE